MNELRELELVLKSRLPIVLIESPDEARIIELLSRIANMEEWPLFVWTVADGLKRAGHTAAFRPPFDPQPEDTADLEAALRHVHASKQSGMFVLCDTGPHLQNPVTQRLLKQCGQERERIRRTFVLLGARHELPADLKRVSATFAPSMATLDDVKRILQDEVGFYRQEHLASRVTAMPETVAVLLQHLVGMAFDDVRRLIRTSLQDDGAITNADLARVLKHKHEALNADGILSFELDTGSFGNVGGLKNMRRWLDRRKGAFLGSPGTEGLDPPKGVLLLGVQGSGKSLAAKAIAGTWGLPLLRLDFASIYNKWTGETERNLRETLRVAEAMAPCVLWIDEIEKGLAPDGGGGDGGLSRRVLGTLLTWMTERKNRVFLAATANDISVLPPELLRKGRFDEIFFVDLPDAATRAEIFRIHLARRKLAPDAFDLAALAAQTEGFSGAEIEQAVVSGQYEAVATSAPLNTQHLADEIRRTRPLSVIMAEKIAELRAWASSRTVPAN